MRLVENLKLKDLMKIFFGAHPRMCLEDETPRLIFIHRVKQQRRVFSSLELDHTE